MKALTRDKRLKTTFWTVIFVCLIFFPSIFYYGVFAVIIVALGAGALFYVSSMFRPPSAKGLHWGRGSIPMSRRSRILVAVLLGIAAVYAVLRVFFKISDSHYLFVVFLTMMLLAAGSGWLDRRKSG
jgi:hypothetical protein